MREPIDFAEAWQLIEQRPSAEDPRSRDWLSGGCASPARALLNIFPATTDPIRLQELAWSALESSARPLVSGVAPRLFVQSGRLVRLIEDEDGARMEPVNADTLAYELTRAAKWWRRDGDRVRPTIPPKSLVSNLLAEPCPPLPILDRIAFAPTFSADGLLAREGYYPEARVYLPSTAEISNLTAMDSGQAKRLLLDDLLGDFPFVSESDQAHAVACLLLPFVRELIVGPTPLHVFEAPTPGTGKSLLAQAVAAVHLGTAPGFNTAPRDDAEWQKLLTSLLRAGPPFVIFDNVSGKLSADSLAQALTAPVWQGRLLGTNTTTTAPIRCTWMVTANNLSLSTDLARRSIRIRLDARIERPFERTGFRHVLPGWALERRPDLISAIIILIQSWLDAGRPSFNERPLGSFESWSAVIGGILEYAGITGFLANADELYEQADQQGSVLRSFIQAWETKHAESIVTTSVLVEVANGVDGLDLGNGNDRSQLTRLGTFLTRNRDRAVAGYYVRKLRRSSAGTQQWQLERVSEEDGKIDGAPSPVDSRIWTDVYPNLTDEDYDAVVSADIQRHGRYSPLRDYPEGAELPESIWQRTAGGELSPGGAR